MGVLVALGAPLLFAPLLAAVAGWGFDAADRGLPGPARITFLLVLLLPALPTVAVFVHTRAIAPRVVVVAVGLASVPLYLGLVMALSWWHH